ARVDLPPRVPRHLQGPRPGHDEQRALPPAPGEGERPRAEADLHLLHHGLALKHNQALSTSVNFGQLMRNMHRWAAHLMVFTVFLHMARVFYHGAYKPPREFNWVVGVILLLLTLLLSFTGYLLPWDQLAIW